MSKPITAFIAIFILLTAFSQHSAASPKRLHAKATKRVPLGKVVPRISPEYKAGIFSWKSTRERIEAYKECMFPEVGRLERALTLNRLASDSEVLSGSTKQLAYEVCLADAMGLERYELQADIEKGKSERKLVEIEADGLVFSDFLPSERRYGRPWVKTYIETRAAEMKKHFKSDYTPLRVGSLVRSFKDQQRQRNSVASCKTEICSSHTTGSAVDLALAPKFTGAREREWLKERLLADRKRGVIVVTEEHYPEHFHVLVLPPQFVSPMRK